MPLMMLRRLFGIAFLVTAISATLILVGAIEQVMHWIRIDFIALGVGFFFGCFVIGVWILAIILTFTNWKPRVEVEQH